MKKLCKCVCVLPFIAASSGCSTEGELFGVPFELVMVESMCWVQAAFATVPEEVPAELEAVQDDPARFGPEDHPLTDVPLGTVIDDLSDLDGCWARYTRQTYEVWDTDRTDVSEDVEVLRFDLAAGELHYHLFHLSRWEDSPDPSVWAFVSSRQRAFMTVVYDLTVVSDNMLVIEITHAEGAAIEDNGDLVYDCGVSNGFFNVGIGSDLTSVVTVQDGYLKYMDTLRDPEDIDLADYEDSGDLFVRFDCPSE